MLLVFGLFLFGPERLPKIAEEAAKALRKLRATLQELTSELKTELGPEIGELDLRTLHPREFVRKHLFEDPPDEELLASPGRVPLGVGERPPWDPDTT